MKTILFLCVFMFVSSFACGDDNKTPKEHLSAFKHYFKIGSIGEANRHFRALPNNSPEYKEAKLIYKYGLKPTSKESAAGLNQRKSFAKQYEKSLLDKGYDVYASTYGKNHTILKLKWVMVNRPLVHQVCNNVQLIDKLRGMGFRKFILSDGYNNSWTIDL